jgi:hypothetical protein
VNRERALEFIHREADAARRASLTARVLVPFTRGQDAPALQFEVELANLDQFERFRDRGIDSSVETGKWMQAFSAILLSPPMVELLRIEAAADTSSVKTTKI